MFRCEPMRRDCWVSGHEMLLASPGKRAPGFCSHRLGSKPSLDSAGEVGFTRPASTDFLSHPMQILRRRRLRHHYQCWVNPHRQKCRREKKAITSRVNREIYARFCRRMEVKSLRPTWRLTPPAWPSDNEFTVIPEHISPAGSIFCINGSSRNQTPIPGKSRYTKRVWEN